jgi:hypothetical protein
MPAHIRLTVNQPRQCGAIEFFALRFDRHCLREFGHLIHA